MIENDISYQRKDPAGGYSVRPMTILMSFAIVVISVVATITSWQVETVVWPAVLAVVVTAASAIGMLYWSNPLRAPYPTHGVVIVFVLAFAALVLSAISMWGSSELITQSWAPLTVGLTQAQLSPYRPARELVGATILNTLTAAFIVILHPHLATAGLPPLVVILDAALPLAALGFGGAAYAVILGRSNNYWFVNAPAPEGVASPAAREGVVRSVQHDRVSILNHTVVPFFGEILQRNRVSDGARDRARVISAAIRSAMVRDVDRSWLDAVMDHLAEERDDGRTPGSEVVQDHDRIAIRMSTEQRIVMRAFIVALFDHHGFDPDGFAILITNEGPHATITLNAKLDSDDAPARSTLAPYFAVLRIAFIDLHLVFDAPALTLKFSYDHK